MLVYLSLSAGASGAWQDKSAGSPWLENFPTRTLGADGASWIILTDKLGRLFVGGEQLQVFDGQAWTAFPISNTHEIHALAFGENGRLWAGAANEAGYFEEEALGIFKYHSILQYMPKGEGLFGVVWACAIEGHSVYFICYDRLLRWDGATIKVWHYDGKLRLVPLKLGDENWFHHSETGLYKLTETGPSLEIPATLLPDWSIFGLAKDQSGLLLAANLGFYRPGSPPRQILNDPLNRYDSNITSFAVLSDGNYALGTLNSGIIIANKTGRLVRTLGTKDGLPTRAIYSITADPAGSAWCSTPEGIFRFDAQGVATLHGPQNGLKGEGVKGLHVKGALVYAFNAEGTFVLDASAASHGKFEQLPQLVRAYNYLFPYRDGLLLARHGGLDFFDGSKLKSLVIDPSKTYFCIQSSRTDGRFYLAEGFDIDRLDFRPDGSHTHAHYLKLPDSVATLYEDSTGQLWMGMEGKGAFAFDPKSKILSPVNDPANGKPLSDHVIVRGTDQRILLFVNGRVLQMQSDGTAIHPIAGIPAFLPIETESVPNKDSIIVAFKNASDLDKSVQHLGVVAFDAEGKPSWQELDVPALNSVGFIHDMDFSQENGRRILWVGGSEGLLRLDYDLIPTLQNPPKPFVFLDSMHSSKSEDPSASSFSFQNHQVSFKAFTGSYSQGKDWSFQTRIGSGETDWSAPSSARTFEFSNLSDGNHRFDVRTVNSSGMASPPASISFRILPPWYRTSPAYAGYVAGLVAAAFGFVRVRERRARAYQRELEKLVDVRTAELLKANAAKDEFLASISHEIRNPLYGVVGIAETFKTESLDPDNRYKFGLLRQCATHLSSLLEDIFDFSRIQAGVIELETEPFDLHELIGSVAAITAIESENRGIPVETAVSPAVPRLLAGDARRIRQILLNYVGNALKFAGRGQISVTVWSRNPAPGATEAFFAVSDEGPGIPPEEQAKLFTRFERGASAQLGRVPGTGLGLALCRTLAERMGGRVWLESEVGQGSCFFFSVPLAVAEAPLPANAAPGPVFRGTFQTALVVDDEEYNRVALTGLLESLDFSVRTAANDREAYSAISGQDFDLIFLDFSLPGRCGPEIARAIRQLPGASAQAVIFAVTAFNTPDKIAECLAAGMNGFLVKPVSMDRLCRALTAVCPLNAQTAAAPAVTDSTPTGRLDNLRNLAAKKSVPFAEEFGRYLAELDFEMEQLATALAAADEGNAGRYAHQLCGRCAFIGERELELDLRQIGNAIAAGRWEEARAGGSQITALRLRLASAAPVGQPASVR